MCRERLAGQPHHHLFRSSLRHSASESSLRGGSATALELAEDAGQERTASMLRNASVSEFDKYGMWGKPEGDDAGGTSGG